MYTANWKVWCGIFLCWMTAYLPCTSSQSSSRLLFKRDNFYVYLIRRKKSFLCVYIYMYHKSSATGGVSVTAKQWATKMKDNNDALQGTKTFRYENKYKSVENTQFFIIVPELSVINLATRVPSKTFCWKNFFFSFVRGNFFSAPGLISTPFVWWWL